MKSNKLFIIENIMLTILIAINVVPEMTNKYILLATVTVLCVVNCMTDKKYFVEFFFKKNYFMYAIYIWCIFNVILFVFRCEFVNIYFLQNYFRICIILVLFMYYSRKQDYRILRNMAIETSILLVIVCIRTIVALHMYSNISRLLATGTDIKFMNTFGVGGYAFIYGLSFVFVALVGVFIKDKRYKNMNKENICLICMILLFGYTILKAQYLISYIIVFIGTLIILLNVNNIRKLIAGIAISIITVCLLSYPLSKILLKISDGMKKESVKMRTIEIAMVLSGEDIQETVDLSARLGHYGESINTFINHPAFGSLFRDKTDTIGGHSFVFDQLAEYGILGSIPAIIMLTSIIYYIFYELNTARSKEIYMACIVMFIIFALTNTIKFVTIFYLIFGFIPAMLKVSEKGERNENSLDS